MDGGVLRPVVWTLQKVSLVSDTVSRCKKPCLTRITEISVSEISAAPNKKEVNGFLCCSKH